MVGKHTTTTNPLEIPPYAFKHFKYFCVCDACMQFQILILCHYLPSRLIQVYPGLKTRVFQGPSLLCWYRTHIVKLTISLISLQILECPSYLVVLSNAKILIFGLFIIYLLIL